MLLRVFGPQAFVTVWPLGKDHYLTNAPDPPITREEPMQPADSNHNPPPASETPTAAVRTPGLPRQPDGKFAKSAHGPKRKRSPKRRVGELIAAQKLSVGLATGVRMKGRDSFGGSIVDPPKDAPTLAEAGIDKHLADRARQLATVPITVEQIAALLQHHRQIVLACEQLLAALTGADARRS